MVRSLFVWSRDLWNGERGENGNLSNAEYVMANKATDKEQKEWPFCSLYYEEGTADDNEGTPIAFSQKTIPWDGGQLHLKTVRVEYPGGETTDFTFPDPSSISQDYDLRKAGSKGEVNYTPAGNVDGVRQGGVSFFVDEIIDMGDGSAEKHREKVKEFLAKQIDAKIAGALDTGSKGAKDSKDAETFESEFSVERVNPTVVQGSEDVNAAETFASESYEANGEAQDVVIDESSMDTVYPEGDGRIMGQSIADADLTPLGSRAEGCGCSNGMCQCADTYEANGAVQDVAFEESPADFVLPEGEGRVLGQSTPTTDFTPLGARAEGFTMEGFATDSFMPEGDGRIVGASTNEVNYTPISRAEDNPRSYRERQERVKHNENRGSSRFGMGQGGITRQSPFVRASEGITDNDGFYPNGDGRIIGSITTEDQYDPFGYNAEEYEANGAVDDVVIDESSMDTVYPEGDGRITGQSISSADFTPLGSRAETMKGSAFFTGVASAFALGLIANIMMNRKSNEVAPDDSTPNEDSSDNSNGE